MSWQGRVAAGVLLAALSGCSRSSTFVVERVTVSEFRGGEVTGQSGDELKTLLASSLEKAGARVVSDRAQVPKDVSPWRVTVAVSLEEPDPSKGAQGEATVLLELGRRVAGEPQGFEARATEVRKARSSKVDDVQDASREALAAAVISAVEEARALADYSDLKDVELLKHLADESPRRRHAAVRLLAERKNPAALEPLLAELPRADDDALRRVMGLLVALGDPRAAGPLIEATKRKDPVLQREVVFALSAIGGEDAEAWLYTVAQGHDDPLVRASAQQALDELKAHHRPKKEERK
jgi:hypothetical protein